MKNVLFFQERTTKNKVRFAEVVEEGKAEVVGHIYVSKWALKAMGSPTALQVTLDAISEPNDIEQEGAWHNTLSPR